MTQILIWFVSLVIDLGAKESNNTKFNTIGVIDLAVKESKWHTQVDMICVINLAVKELSS